MPNRLVVLIAGAVLLAATSGLAQPRARGGPRTPDGRPDFQGNWTNATLTPIERPAGRGLILTAAEVAALEGRRQARNDSLNLPSDPNRPAPPKGGVSIGDPQFDAAAGGTGGYNIFFIDGGDRIAVINGEARASLVTRPANGRVPSLPAARARLAAVFNQFTDYSNPESRPLAERCILSFGSNAGPPMLPNYFYNNNYTIVQTKDHVAILTEMVHDTRIIPMGDGPRLPSRYMGDSRGRWIADTLVIETVNIHPAQAATFFGATSAMRVVERLSRIDHRTLLYRFVVEDSASFAEPWGGEVPLRRLDDRIFEYACHEGNYAMANVLSGARDEERRKGEKP
ncbi:MAG: hypothetical protein ACKVZ0_14525 [Gemmatimonadales bacterium]